MDRDTRIDLVLVVAGLAGIVTGQVARRLASSPARRARSEFTGIGAASLVATPLISRAMTDASGADARNLPLQAALTFATGAFLAFFAEEIGRHVPGLPGIEPAGQR